MVSPNLVFESPRLVGSPTNLVFGVIGAPVVVVAVDAVVTLDGTVTVSAVVSSPVLADGLVLLSGSVDVVAAALYDNRVTPWLDQRAAAPHQTAVPDLTGTGSGWGVTTERRESREMPWQLARRAGDDVGSAAQTSVSMLNPADVLWQTGLQVNQVAAVVHQTSVQHVTSRVSGYETALQTGAESESPMQTGVFHAKHLVAEWQWANSKVRDLTTRLGRSAHLSGAKFEDALWQVAGSARNGKTLLPLPPVGPPPFQADGHLLFECPPGDTDLIFGYSCTAVGPIGLVVVPVRRVYMVVNNATLRRVDGNIALPTFSMALSLNADSWTWTFSANLPGHVLPDLEPAYSGAPVEVEAMINGVAYRALVERIGRSREFGKNSISVQGRGKTALLDSPYAPSQNFINTGARTAQQLMADVLTVNGVPMDWAINWGLEDWLVPAGVFAHQGSYIGALNAIAGAAGGYIQPHASLQTISVLPRYAAAPWNWGAVTPDFDLPSDVTTRESIEWVERARYNRVFVSGQQDGVLGQVTRTGTSGDILAPMVTDALITTAAAARQRGLSILANTGRQAEISLRLPVLSETGIIAPGKFVQYTDAGVVRRGVVRSTNVDVGMPEIWQTIGVETHA